MSSPREITQEEPVKDMLYICNGKSRIMAFDKVVKEAETSLKASCSSC
ncbi:MAG: hypothetical protein MZV63_70070 [Marinilabiliales bacterium]|nr:hypothetical protein [Marinilabiliales bacterium]